MSNAPRSEPKTTSTLLLAIASLVAAVGVHRIVPAMHDGGVWALITLAAGVYALGQSVVALVGQRKAPASIWPAWPAALMAVATLAAGAAGNAALRRSTDEFVEFVDKAFSGQDKDTEHAQIQTSHFRYLGYSAARNCATTGLRLGVVSLALALTALGRALRARRKQQAAGGGEGALPTSSPVFWMASCGVLGIAALAADVAAAGRAVPMAEDPDVAESALIARRFVAGDVAGACRVLEPAVEASAAAADGLKERLPDLADKAARCVDYEVKRGRAMGEVGCEALMGMVAPMRFVQFSGKTEAVASGCEGLQVPPR